jgi:hypothetical protein
VDRDGYYLDRTLWLKLYYHWFLSCDGYCHCTLWFFMLFWTITGITKFYKLWLEIYYHWVLGHNGYCHYAPWFFMLFRTVTGITKFYKLWPEIYYHWVLGRNGYCYYAPWWVLLLCPVILYVVFDCNRYYFVYVTLCFCVSLTPSLFG